MKTQPLQSFRIESNVYGGDVWLTVATRPTRAAAEQIVVELNAEFPRTAHRVVSK